LPAMYTVDEVAKILRRSPQTIRKLIKRKKIPAVRVGGGWLVSETTLQRLINGEIDTED
jgi:excisionase family DNA binding protein